MRTTTRTVYGIRAYMHNKNTIGQSQTQKAHERDENATRQLIREKAGAGDGIRTRDPCHGKAVLYH